MLHADFVRMIEARKASIIHALVRSALPAGARFAVFVALEKSDDPAEKPVAAVIANIERGDISRLVNAFCECSHGQTH